MTNTDGDDGGDPRHLKVHGVRLTRYGHVYCHLGHAVVDECEQAGVQGVGDEKRTWTAIHQAASDGHEQSRADGAADCYKLDLTVSQVSFQGIGIATDLDNNISHSLIGGRSGGLFVARVDDMFIMGHMMMLLLMLMTDGLDTSARLAWLIRAVTNPKYMLIKQASEEAKVLVRVLTIHDWVTVL